MQTKTQAQHIAIQILASFGVIATDNENLKNLPEGLAAVTLVNQLEDKTQFAEDGVEYCFTIEMGNQLTTIEI